MRNTIFLLLFLAAFIACKKTKAQTQTKTPNHSETTDYIIPKGTYINKKISIAQLRAKLKTEYPKARDKGAFLDSVSHIFTNYLLDSMIPYWYGTEWTFEGHTAQPNDGSVACGYFVSTTLKQMGLNLNRYKMAQQASKLEVQTIAIDPNNVTSIKNPSNFKQLKDGLYIVGLDNHVGYILRKPNHQVFIHSDYVSGQVVRQKTEDAAAFGSQVYYFGKISGNRALMQKWLTGKRLKVIMPKPRTSSSN